MVQKEVRTSLERHLLQLPFSYFDEKGTGSIITRLISDIEEMGRFFSEILPSFLINMITVITATVYLIEMDTMLIVVLFASYPIMLIVADRLSKKLAELTKNCVRIWMNVQRKLMMLFKALLLAEAITSMNCKSKN